MTDVQATHHVELHDIKAWLADYGFDPNDVFEVTIHLGRYSGPAFRPGPANGAYAISAWAEVEWMKRDEHGHRYTDDGNDVATGTSTIPLRSFPTLTAAAKTDAA